MEKYIENHTLYACDKCCTKLTRESEPCPHCHRGNGIQVYPVRKQSAQEIEDTERRTGMFRNIKRR